METDPREPLALPKPCVCCGTLKRTIRRAPLCDACVAPDEIRSYCAKCQARRVYGTEDIIRLMSSLHPDIALMPGMVMRLPACAACKDDGRPPVDGGTVRFFGISFD